MLNIGEMLLARRMHLGKSLSSMGKEIGISNNFLSEIERNLKSPSSNTMDKIAKGYDIPIETLCIAYRKLPSIVVDYILDNEELLVSLCDTCYKGQQ